VLDIEAEHEGKHHAGQAYAAVAEKTGMTILANSSFVVAVNLESSARPKTGCRDQTDLVSP